MDKPRKSGVTTGSGGRPNRFLTLVYRMPASPTSGRVAVWRQLKKIGGIYLQQSVTVFPRVPQVLRDLKPLLERIDALGGEFHLLPLARLSPPEEAKLIAMFVDQSSRHYQEIIENCEVNFTKEIEFETFRRNFTYEEAEEIRTEFDKIVGWYERVQERDWFGAPNRQDALDWLQRSQAQLEEFEAAVYATQADESPPPNDSRPVIAGGKTGSARRRPRGSRRREPRIGSSA